MISLNFGLFWAGKSLSYLRFLTFKTLRHFHPDAKIQLFLSKEYKQDGFKWGREKQDFEGGIIGIDYLDKLKDLNVEIVPCDIFKRYPPNYQSDFFRWWYLFNFGGFYLDNDQIILKSFQTLPLDKEMIYCSYGNYSPVGVIGAEKGSKSTHTIMRALPSKYNPNDYNSLGPWMMRDMISHLDKNRLFNAPQQYFYPIPFSDLIISVYEGKFNIPKTSYALHWFGGLQASQKFNRRYTEETLKTGNDTISRIVRDMGL